MSTKIHNGFKIDSASLIEVMSMINAFRPFVIKAGEEMRDAFCENNPSAAWDDRQMAIKKTQHRDPGADTDFNITLFPDGDAMLGIVYCEHREWIAEWLKQPKVSEYRYWNNTDHPEDVSDEEWEAREKAWDRVLTFPIPAMCGFSVSVSDPNGPCPKAWRKPEPEKSRAMKP